MVYEPTFNGEDIEDQTIIVGANWEFTLPTFTDGFGLNCRIFALEIGKAADFLVFDAVKNSLKLKIDPVLLE